MLLVGTKLWPEAPFLLFAPVIISIIFLWCPVCFWALVGNFGTIAPFTYIYIYIYIYCVCVCFLYLWQLSFPVARTSFLPFVTRWQSFSLVWMIFVFAQGCIICFTFLVAYVSLGVASDLHLSKESYHLAVLGGLCPFEESLALSVILIYLGNFIT